VIVVRDEIMRQYFCDLRRQTGDGAFTSIGAYEQHSRRPLNLKVDVDEGSVGVVLVREREVRYVDGHRRLRGHDCCEQTFPNGCIRGYFCVDPKIYKYQM